RAEARLHAGDREGSRADAEAARKLGVAPVLLDLLTLHEAVLSGDRNANFRAMAALKDRLAGWPKELMAWVYLGLSLQRDEGQATFKELGERYPTYPYMAMSRAMVAERAHKTADALAIMQASLKDYPFHRQLQLGIAYYQVQLRQFEPALALIEQIRESSL